MAKGGFDALPQQPPMEQIQAAARELVRAGANILENPDSTRLQTHVEQANRALETLRGLARANYGAQPETYPGAGKPPDAQQLGQDG